LKIYHFGLSNKKRKNVEQFSALAFLKRFFVLFAFSLTWWLTVEKLPEAKPKRLKVNYKRDRNKPRVIYISHK